MNKFVLTVVLALLLQGCQFPKTEYGPHLSEAAEITEVVYTPAQHGSSTSVGMSMSGNMVVSGGSVRIPEVFAVVFRCEHGKFIIHRKDVWEKAKPGMKVLVRYREVFRVSGGKRDLVKYDFLDFSEQ